MIDKTYCSSSYLMYRTIMDNNMQFSDKFKPSLYTPKSNRTLIRNSFELEDALKAQVYKICSRKKAALALSGGIDSAILAKFMPKGSVAYTFQCVVDGKQAIDETTAAAKYAKECGLNHKIIKIYKEDLEKYTSLLMTQKGQPIHSIEIQIYKAALQSCNDGHDAMIYGESADANYGGLDGLLSQNYTIGDFIDRYSYVIPYKVLKKFEIITEPIVRYQHNGFVDVHEFVRNVFFCESMGSYTNACSLADIEFVAPFADTKLAAQLDLSLVRNGENKYIVRELFKRLYPNFVVPKKIPMPRPMDEWFKNWGGPTRPEFLPNCIEKMSGDQKFYIWCLEKFLSLIDHIS